MYTVKILPNEEFDKLPYKHTKTSLGMADPSTNVAYIRDTGYNDVTKQTIAHELDELMASVSPHEEDGIRYKNMGDMFGKVGKSVGNFFGGGNQSTGPVDLVSATPPTGSSNALAAFGGGTKPFTPRFPSGPSQISSAGPSSKNALAAFGGGTKPFSPPTNLKTPGGVFGKAQQTGGGLMNTIGDFMTGGGADQPGEVGMKDFAAPLALNLIGNMLAPSQPSLDFSGITNNLRGQLETGVNGPLNQTALTELEGIITQDPSQPPDSAFVAADQNIDDQLEKDIESLTKQFKAARPGADVQNDSAFRDALAEIQERSRERRAAVRDELSFQHQREQMQRKMTGIQTALNLDQAQMQQYIQLAQLDIASIMAQAGVTQAEAMQIKQLFGDLGSLAFRQSTSGGGQDAS